MSESDRGHTPIKHFRLAEDLYRAALRKAKSEGRTLTSVIRDYLHKYVSGDEPPEDKDQS